MFYGLCIFPLVNGASRGSSTGSASLSWVPCNKRKSRSDFELSFPICSLINVSHDKSAEAEVIYPKREHEKLSTQKENEKVTVSCGKSPTVWKTLNSRVNQVILCNAFTTDCTLSWDMEFLSRMILEGPGRTCLPDVSQYRSPKETWTRLSRQSNSKHEI